MQPHALPLKRMPAPPHHTRHPLIKRIRKPYMSHDAALEKRKRSHPLGAVDDLIWYHKVARLDLLLQGADGAEGDDAAHAERAEGGDVGAVRHFVRRERVVRAVAGEEGDGDRIVGEDGDGRGGSAPGGGGREGGDRGEAFEVLEAGAADDGYVDGSLGG
jgi:hypothetical protein